MMGRWEVGGEAGPGHQKAWPTFFAHLPVWLSSHVFASNSAGEKVILWNFTVCKGLSLPSTYQVF